MARRACDRRSRSGATLLELLVVIGIVALLAGLVLPAIQQSRETARATDCRNRMRQLGVAAHGYLSSRQTFPAFSVHLPLVSPHRNLLPFLDQDPLFRRIDANDPSVDQPGHPPEERASGANRELLKIPLPAFLCPSDTQLPGATNYRACTGYGQDWHPGGPGFQCTEPGNAAGAFVLGRGTRPQEFLDGMANTALFGERVLGDQDPGTYRPFVDCYFHQTEDGPCTVAQMEVQCRKAFAGAPHDSYQGATWLYAGYHRTLYNHLAGPNASLPDCSPGDFMVGGGPSSTAARSWHRQGVNLCLADGAVRFVNDRIDLAVWRALSTRAASDLASE